MANVAWNSTQAWSGPQTWNGYINDGSGRYFLLSPVREIGPLGDSQYVEFLALRRGDTVVKRDGEWLTVRNKRQDWLDGCDVVFRGGYENEVTSGQKTELEAAGYTVETRTV